MTTTITTRRQAQATIEAMQAEMGTQALMISLINGRWWLDWSDAENGEYSASGDTLDDAFINALYEQAPAGVEPPPF